MRVLPGGWSRLLACWLMGGLANASHAAEPTPSVLVSTVLPRRGTLPETVIAFGAARPAFDAATTISQQIDGQVAAIAVTPGEAVQAGEPLLEFLPSPAAISLYRQAVTALSVARGARTHTAQLLAGHLATRDQLAQADKSVADAAASLAALQSQGGGGAKTTVRAPFDGIIDSIPVAQGMRVAPGAPLLTLTARGGLVVTVGIGPADLDRVRVGEAVELTRLSGGASLSGEVLRVDAVLNPRTRLVDADVSIPKPAGPNPVGPGDAVLSGEAFTARIVVREVQGWLVPHASVLSDEHGAWVFQVADGHGARVDVTRMVNDADTDLVTGTLDPARPLVVDGAWQIQDGMPARTNPVARDKTAAGAAP